MSWLPGDLVADQARTTRADSGQCACCPRDMQRGERIARLPNGSWAHVACLTGSDNDGGSANYVNPHRSET